MEYMHIKVQVDGDAFEVLDEFATNLILVADEKGAEIGKRGLKPACLRGIAYGLLFSLKLLGADAQASKSTTALSTALAAWSASTSWTGRVACSPSWQA